MRIVFASLETKQDLIAEVFLNCAIDGVKPFKFISFTEFGIPVYSLFPDRNILKYLRASVYGDSNSLDFDKAYYQQLMYNENSFKDLMKILSVIQERDITFILADYDNEMNIAIIDSLAKMLDVRYGLSTYIVSQVEDLDENFLKDTNFKDSEGYANYVADCERYARLIQNTNINGDEKVLQNEFQAIKTDYELLDQLTENGQLPF